MNKPKPWKLATKPPELLSYRRSSVSIRGIGIIPAIRDFDCRSSVLRGFIPAKLTTQRQIGTAVREFERPCPVCGDTVFTPYWQKGDLRIVCCTTCGMVYANPAPPGMASGQFYDDTGAEYYLSRAKLEGDYADVRFERELKLFREFCRRGATLDVGCSSGAFLFQLKRHWPRDYEILGTDVSGAPLDYAESRGVPVVRGSFLEQDFGGRRFDAVTFWATLEHLADPQRFLAKAATLLSSGGLCFVLVPNGKSLAARLLGVNYRYVYPQHLNYFTRVTLARLCAGSFSTVDMRFTHFNPLVIWQDWRGGGRAVSNGERAALLQRTTAYKQSVWFRPLKVLYRVAENILGTFKLADNLVAVLRKR